jgi:hypothetical protein
VDTRVGAELTGVDEKAETLGSAGGEDRACLVRVKAPVSTTTSLPKSTAVMRCKLARATPLDVRELLQHVPRWRVWQVVWLS